MINQTKINELLNQSVTQTITMTVTVIWTRQCNRISQT